MATTCIDSDASPEGVAKSLLVRLVRIMAACGLDRDALIGILKDEACSCVGAPDMRHLLMSHEEHLACTAIVFRWRRDTAFLDASGLPAVLPIAGPGPSLQALAEASSWSRSLQDLVLYLTEVGAVSPAGKLHLRLVSESVLTCTGGRRAVLAPMPLLGQIESFLECVEYNVLEKKDITRGRFERACYAPIPVDLAAVFERLVEARAQELIDSVDEWLSRHASTKAEEFTTLAGVGAYTILKSNINK